MNHGNDTRSWIQEHQENSAHDFLEALSPVHGLLGSEPEPHSCLYRGVSNEMFELVPTAYRQSVASARESQVPAEGVLWRDQIGEELRVLQLFVSAVDRQGHLIPEDSQKLRRSLEDLRDSLGPDLDKSRALSVWPPAELLSSLALAQHYGVPTRMLDWTLDPYIAAYFAAVGAASSRETSGRLCVWAFVKDRLDIAALDSDGGVQDHRLPLRYVTAPGSGNANLRAQRGVFLVQQQFDIGHNDLFQAVSYDRLLIDCLHVAEPLLYKISMPCSKAPALLWLLSLQGIDASTVFPGLDGAAKAVVERDLWHRDLSVDTRSPRIVEAVRKYSSEE